MTPEDRNEKNSLAFLDHVAGMGGYKLRPLGYLTTENLSLLEMRMAMGKEAFAELDEEQIRDEVHAYLFIQAAPLPDVSRAIRAYRKTRRSPGGGTLPNRSEAWEHFIMHSVEPFLATLAPEDKRALEEQLESIDEIGATRIETAPPAGQKTERSDPNS